MTSEIKLNSNSVLENYCTFLVAFMPILNIYCIFTASLGIGDLFAVGAFFLLILGKKRTMYIRSKMYMIFVAYMILISMILTLVIPTYSIGEMSTKCIKLVVYSILAVSIIPMYWKASKGKNLFINITFIAAVYLIAQYILHVFARVDLPMAIPFLKTLYNNTSGSQYNGDMLNMYARFGYRASGFFLEPSHFCQYAVIGFVFLVFSENKKRIDKIKLAVITTAMIASFSAIGYFMIMATVFVWFFYTFKQRSAAINFLLMLIGAVSIVFISIKTGAYDSAMERVSTIQDNEVATGSLRLLRGFIVYRETPGVFKYIGIGCGNYVGFVSHFSISTFFDSRIGANSEYMSTISTILLNGGIIGLVLYFCSIFQIMKKTSIIKKAIFANFIIILVATASFFSLTYVVFLSLLCSRDAQESTGDQYDE